MIRHAWKRRTPLHIDENPYFQTDREKNHRAERRERFAQGLALLFALTGVASILLYHPIFFIRTINVQGAQTIPAEILEEAALQSLNGNRLAIFPKKNVFFIDREGIRRSLESKVFAKDITIIPKWAGVLQITIEEYPTVVHWRQSGLIYGMNEQGYITEQIPKNKEDQISPMIEDSSNEVSIGKQLLSPETLHWILNMIQVAKNQLSWQPTLIITSTTNPEIIQVVRNELIVLLTMEDDAEAQILRLRAVLHSKPQLLADKHTIDLRFKEKIYFR